ncbi:hypothetical protein OOT00_02780 [Desulfobotulus sp. H1]|uniref:Aldehyde ferredoxin oxidoreductase N-terminal domain-containing protein n=1 Tax=Desulfobotulus pelophilus TaxID=2823377 RepID=A0ABT3N625_9BACT|nr:aldehyde ferredoxin oxidoreductase C-terminal domain-containing protein [Desulfobotulus pelophilus]MCW7752904.1 hypothetical protein [Desulfobotulus pelophilus]
MKPLAILDIYLGSGRIHVTMSKQEAPSGLGGMGLNAATLHQDLHSSRMDALSPDNILVFSPGVLTGSGFPTAARTEVSALSPLTGLFGTSNSGLFFGGDLKRAGFDSLILRERAPHPVYITILDREVSIHPAHELWGKDSWEAITWLEGRYPKASLALIGTAGENQVRFASIQNHRHDAWGRTGLGAVMGSKNVKAVVIKGSGKVRAHDKDSFHEIRQEATRAIRASRYYDPFKKYGTLGASPAYGKFNALPTRNFSGAHIPDWSKKFGQNLLKTHVTARMACESCWIACGHMVRIAEGIYAGQALKALEISPTITFCAQCGLTATDSFRATEFCQRFGMDMLSAGSCAAMAFQLYEEKKLTVKDTGYPLPWGDVHAFCRLLEDMALRRGIGRILADGTARAAAALGYPEYAMHVRKLEMPMIDPRGRWSSYSFGMLTNIRGGDHLRCRNPFENLKENIRTGDGLWEAFLLPEEEYHKADIVPETLRADMFDLEQSRVYLPLMVRWSEDLITLFNTLGICIRPPILNSLGPTLLSRALNSFTGIFLPPEQLMMTAATSWDTIRRFNLSHGDTPDAARFPHRFFLPCHGKTPLDEENIHTALQAYYRVRGWDSLGTPRRRDS